MQIEIDRDAVSMPVGRFAPSPTGPLHFGTLVAALGSYLMAKSGNGRWFLRIEDIDRPRVVDQADAEMLKLLEQLGFAWDGEPVYQSRRLERYREAVAELRVQGLLYPCNCTRREILASAPQLEDQGPIYPGTCRREPQGQRAEQAWRLRVPDEVVTFTDLVYGPQQQNLERQVGDFVLHRVDGVFAYQLVVVVDDLDAGVNQVVRGADLLSSTPRQIYLWRCFGAPVPDFLHLPLALGSGGKKLSKRHGREGVVTSANGGQMLWQALEFLGQTPPPELFAAPAGEVLRWGVEHFSRQAIATTSRPYSAAAIGCPEAC
jgi:glutamyl-Q tRNA(Asp) synthetase